MPEKAKRKRQPTKKRSIRFGGYYNFWTETLALEGLLFCIVQGILPLIPVLMWVGVSFFFLIANFKPVESIILLGIFIILVIIYGMFCCFCGVFIMWFYGLCGMIYGTLLYYLRRFSFSPLQSPAHYRRFSRRLLAFLFVPGIVYIALANLTVTYWQSQYFFSSAWAFFTIMFIWWRLLRVNRRFIRRYFGIY